MVPGISHDRVKGARVGRLYTKFRAEYSLFYSLFSAWREPKKISSDVKACQDAALRVSSTSSEASPKLRDNKLAGD
jgi:hypothetical protein